MGSAAAGSGLAVKDDAKPHSLRPHSQSKATSLSLAFSPSLILMPASASLQPICCLFPWRATLSSCTSIRQCKHMHSFAVLLTCQISASHKAHVPRCSVPCMLMPVPQESHTQQTDTLTLPASSPAIGSPSKSPHNMCHGGAKANATSPNCPPNCPVVRYLHHLKVPPTSCTPAGTSLRLRSTDCHPLVQPS